MLEALTVPTLVICGLSILAGCTVATAYFLLKVVVWSIRVLLDKETGR